METLKGILWTTLWPIRTALAVIARGFIWAWNVVVHWAKTDPKNFVLVFALLLFYAAFAAVLDNRDLVQNVNSSAKLNQTVTVLKLVNGTRLFAGLVFAFIAGWLATQLN